MRDTCASLLKGAGISALFVVVLFASAAWAQEETPLDSILIDGHLHTPAEIFRLMDRSAVIYEIAEMSDSEMTALQSSRTILPPGIFPVVKDNEAKFCINGVGDEADSLYNHAEYLYGEGEYAEARNCYRHVLELQSNFTSALTLIGDCFYSEGNQDSAVFYFREAITANPTDYQARYFLADALWEKGDSAASVETLTAAHILNVHHEDIFSKLKRRRYAMGKPWKEWSFIPVCKLEPIERGVNISTAPAFLGYALAKALWGYEPGYTEKMVDSTDLTEHVLHLLEEKEAVACAFMANDSLKTAVLDRIDLKDFTDFVMYEVIAKKNPELMLVLPPEARDKLVEYLNRYH